MKWAVAVITAPRKPCWLEHTVESLRRAGWDKITLYAEPDTPVRADLPHLDMVLNPRRLGPHLNSRRALTGLVEQEPAADAYVVFQDDIEVTRNVRGWLEKTGLWPSCRVGVVSLYTAAVNHREQPGWHKCDDLPKRAHGALAYAFPPDAARDFLAQPPPSKTWGQQDYWVGRWCRNAGLEYWMHSPSFVRHLGEVSTIQTRPLDEYRQCRVFLEEIDISESP